MCVSLSLSSLSPLVPLTGSNSSTLHSPSPKQLSSSASELTFVVRPVSLAVAIFAGGFLPVATNPTFEGYFPIEQTPTLHIIGNVDVIIGEARSLALVENCHDARIERHDGGESITLSRRQT